MATFEITLKCTHVTRYVHEIAACNAVALTIKLSNSLEKARKFLRFP